MRNRKKFNLLTIIGLLINALIILIDRFVINLNDYVVISLLIIAIGFIFAGFYKEIKNTKI